MTKKKKEEMEGERGESKERKREGGKKEEGRKRKRKGGRGVDFLCQHCKKKQYFKGYS